MVNDDTDSPKLSFLKAEQPQFFELFLILQVSLLFDRLCDPSVDSQPVIISFVAGAKTEHGISRMTDKH